MHERSLYTAWCEANNCTHGHCPHGCEHPQPGHYAGDGRLLCGSCWFRGNEAVLIVPCTPEEGCRDG